MFHFSPKKYSISLLPVLHVYYSRGARYFQNDELQKAHAYAYIHTNDTFYLNKIIYSRIII